MNSNNRNVCIAAWIVCGGLAALLREPWLIMPAFVLTVIYS